MPKFHKILLPIPVVDEEKNNKHDKNAFVADGALIAQMAFPSFVAYPKRPRSRTPRGRKGGECGVELCEERYRASAINCSPFNHLLLLLLLLLPVQPTCLIWVG